MNFRFKKAELGIFNTINSDECLSSFSKECRILGLTRGQFSLIDLIRSILNKTGKANVIVTTWSAGIKDAHQIEWMVNNDLINDFKIITDHSYATRQKKYAAALDDLFGKENIRTSEIHAKFTLIWNEQFKVCIRTSMNLNANKTCENFEIDEDSDIFDFYMEFIQHHFDDLPIGFTESSSKVNESLDRFFKTQNSKEKIESKSSLIWSEI